VCSGAARRLPALISAVELVHGNDAITNFEDKYFARGDPLWRLELPARTEQNFT
jgi:hypothetical protein